MKIDEIKNKFIEILYAHIYKQDALSENLDLNINRDVLEENEIYTSTLVEVILPLLYKEGLLKRYESKLSMDIQRLRYLPIINYPKQYRDKIYYKFGINAKKVTEYHLDLQSSKKDKHYYITEKENECFYYKDVVKIDFDKSTNYYKVFYVLYKLRPQGGSILYKDLMPEVKIACNLGSDKNIRTFIQNNITGKKNGFLVKMSEYDLDPRKPLIKNLRMTGIEFNNEIN